jgi:hypothetical protein
MFLLRVHRRALQQGRGLFTVLMCADCQAARGYGSGPYPVMTRAELRAGLDLMATWALAQKAAANRQVIDIMRRRLAAGEEVARMYQEPGLAGSSPWPRSPRAWWPSATRQPSATADGAWPSTAAALFEEAATTHRT